MVDDNDAIDLMERAGLLDNPDTSPYIHREEGDFSIEDKITLFEGAGLLTDRQAEAIVLRSIEGLSRDEAANEMDISPSTLDDYVRAGKDKIAHASMTTQVSDLFDVWD